MDNSEPHDRPHSTAHSGNERSQRHLTYWMLIKMYLLVVSGALVKPNDPDTCTHGCVYWYKHMPESIPLLSNTLRELPINQYPVSFLLLLWQSRRPSLPQRPLRGLRLSHPPSHPPRPRLRVSACYTPPRYLWSIFTILCPHAASPTRLPTLSPTVTLTPAPTRTPTTVTGGACTRSIKW